jgi:hypothetical protein
VAVDKLLGVLKPISERLVYGSSPPKARLAQRDARLRSSRETNRSRCRDKGRSYVIPALLRHPRKAGTHVAPGLGPRLGSHFAKRMLVSAARSLISQRMTCPVLMGLYRFMTSSFTGPAAPNRRTVKA